MKEKWEEWNDLKLKLLQEKLGEMRESQKKYEDKENFKEEFKGQRECLVLGNTFRIMQVESQIHLLLEMKERLDDTPISREEFDKKELHLDVDMRYKI